MHTSNEHRPSAMDGPGVQSGEIKATAPARGEGGTTAPARRGGETRTPLNESTSHAPPAHANWAEPNSLAPGAPVSNTAPANCMSANGVTDFQVLRFGVDSLYLSYPGLLAGDWAERLEALKQSAQSSDERERANAQVEIGGHLFEVADKGRGRFAYVLADNCFVVQVSGGHSEVLPLAYVQLASELLTAMSVTAAEEDLRYIVTTLGKVRDHAQVSRADLFVDFLSSVAMDSWPPVAWITRAAKIWLHTENRQFTGWSIGLGGALGARLYDKTLELEKSHKDYLKPLWAVAGWQPGQTVWRLEFQLRREALTELGVTTVPDLLKDLAGLWDYATGSWLRLTIPNPFDATATRWPDHPLWSDLAGVPWSSVSPAPLARVRMERVPSDESLFVNGLSGLTSFMARHGMTDLGEGFGEFLAHAE